MQPTQLFVDDGIVTAKRDLVRTLHPGRRLAQPVLVPDRPWEGQRVYLYGSVHHDPDGGGFRMWYLSRVPSSMWESAKMDGAREWTIIWRIMVPIVQATVAFIALFYAVWQWNGWFYPSLFLESRGKHPIQLLLREIPFENIGSDSMMTGGAIPQSQTEIYRLLVRYSTIIVATAPILVVYPFLQRYFIKGVMVGSLKG